jgi:alkylhydroperoxidase family enzyme
MLKWLIRNRLAAFERTWDYDMSYARALLDADTRALLAFAKTEAMNRYRKGVPKDVYFAVKLAGLIAEDCGPCTQLVVTMALREGVDAKTIAAVVRGDDAAMSEEVRLGVAFARAVIAHAPAADELRETIAARWGQKGVVSLTFAVVMARVFPTMKYGLGFGKACQRVVVAGAPIAVLREVA